MKTSEQINEISAALAKFQGAVDPVKKNKQVKIPTKKGDLINFKYSDLTEIINTIRKPLSENGLSVSQSFSPGENGKSFMITTVFHASGQYISSNLAMPPWADIKTLGANMTYLRRYSLSSILSLVTDEDIDATELENKDPVIPEASDDETKVFITLWKGIYDPTMISEFLTYKCTRQHMTPRMAVTMYTKAPEGFQKEIDAWVAQKKEGVQSEAD